MILTRFCVGRPPENPEERRQWIKELTYKIQNEINKEVTKAKTLATIEP